MDRVEELGQLTYCHTAENGLEEGIIFSQELQNLRV
jgi:hypothetical protein